MAVCKGWWSIIATIRPSISQSASTKNGRRVRVQSSPVQSSPVLSSEAQGHSSSLTRPTTNPPSPIPTMAAPKLAHANASTTHVRSRFIPATQTSRIGDPMVSPPVSRAPREGAWQREAGLPWEEAGENRHVCSGSPGRNAPHSCSPVGIGLEFVLARLAGGWMPLCRLGRPVALRRRPSGEIFSLDGAPVQRDAEASLCCYRLVYGWSCLACFLGGEFQTGDQTTG